MNDQKKILIEKIVVAIMLVVLGLSFLYSKIRSEKKLKAPKAGTEVFNLEAAKKLLKDIQKKGAVRDDSMEDVIDPTKRPDEFTPRRAQTAVNTNLASTPQQQKLMLEGIIWGGKKSMAMISGEVVTEGDVVAGAKVEKIETDEVVLTKDGETIKLTR